MTATAYRSSPGPGPPPGRPSPLIPGPGRSSHRLRAGGRVPLPWGSKPPGGGERCAEDDHGGDTRCRHRAGGGHGRAERLRHHRARRRARPALRAPSRCAECGPPRRGSTTASPRCSTTSPRRRSTQFFKPETLGIATPGPTTTETPQAGVTIVRDAYHVAHIHGVTRDDVTWGAGWVVAEDRGLLLQQARYDSLRGGDRRPGPVSALGPGLRARPASAPTAQTEAEVAKQTSALLAYGSKGQRRAPRHRRLPGGHQRLSRRPRRQPAPVHPHRHLCAQRAQGPVRRSGRR